MDMFVIYVGHAQNVILAPPKIHCDKAVFHILIFFFETFSSGSYYAIIYSLMLDYMYHSLLNLALKILLTQYNNTIKQ